MVDLDTLVGNRHLNWPVMREQCCVEGAGSAGSAVLRTSRAAGSSWWLLAAVLAGLFAMHGLGTHGTHATHSVHGDEPVAMVAAASSASSPSMHADAVHADAMTPSTGAEMTGGVAAGVVSVATATAAATAAVQVDAWGGDAWSAGALAGLCFVVLTALAAWALTRARVGGAVAVAPPAVRGLVARGAGRDRDPPSRIALSVHRC